MTRCPECGEPPHYHSFCTLCAQLFRTPLSASGREFKNDLMERRMRAASLAHFTVNEAAARIGCSPGAVCWWRRRLGLPAFARKPYKRRGRRFSHALDC